QFATRYSMNIDQQSILLNVLTKKFYLTEYATLTRIADAGRWILENQSCFLGLAMVWKLQVDAHADECDWHLCTITCGGNFMGGALHLPDLNISLEYKLGDIVIFRSSMLYHSIREWIPGIMHKGDPCTPGCVS
ncbi:hypothetical protein F5146DRAFT_937634, partial [Armillaria mellea]